MKKALFLLMVLFGATFVQSVYCTESSNSAKSRTGVEMEDGSTGWTSLGWTTAYCIDCQYGGISELVEVFYKTVVIGELGFQKEYEIKYRVRRGGGGSTYFIVAEKTVRSGDRVYSHVVTLGGRTYGLNL